MKALFNDMSWEIAETEINTILTHLAVREKVGASTQYHALSALLFLYYYIIGREVGDLGEVILARKPKRLHDALDRKYPNAPKEWRWQWVFPQENRWKNTKTGKQRRP